MGKIIKIKFWMGAVFFAFLLSLIGFTKPAQATCDTCYCWGTCCTYFNILGPREPMPKGEGDDDDGIIDPVWECVNCQAPDEFCVPREGNEASTSEYGKLAQDSDGDMICDHCDNCKDVPNGFIEVSDENACERNGSICEELFDRSRLSNVTADSTCMIVDQADTNLDGVGDACE